MSLCATRTAGIIATVCAGVDLVYITTIVCHVHLVKKLSCMSIKVTNLP